MEKLNPDKVTLKKFGMTMGIAFLVISSLFLFRHKHAGVIYSLVVSCVFFIMRLFVPTFLKPVYAVWMRFAFVLGWVNTRIILIVMFYLIFTPIGLVMRLFRADPLERNKKEDTYWKKKDKEAFDFKNYERRF